MRHKICLLGIMLSSAVAAQHFTWNAVATQGVFHTDDNNLYGQSEDDVSFDFTELSLNASYNFTHGTRFAVQGVYRHAGAGFDGVDLDYLFIDKQLWGSDSYVGGIRLGRVKDNYGLYNDSRDIAFTRPSIYLPQSVYLDLSFRKTLLYADGFSLYLERIDDTGLLTLEGGFGVIDGDGLENYQTIDAFSDFPFSFDVDEGFFYRLKYSTLDERLKLAFSGFGVRTISASSTFDASIFMPNLQIPFDIGARTRYNLLSLEYVFGQWIFAAEYGEIVFKLEEVNFSIDPFILASLPISLESQLPSLDTESEIYFLQLSRILSRTIELFARVDVYHIDKSDPNGVEYERNGLGVSHSRYTKDYGVGIRWQPRMDTMINFEYHYIDGTGWLNPQENPGFQVASERYWNVVAASISYRF